MKNIHAYSYNLRPGSRVLSLCVLDGTGSKCKSTVKHIKLKIFLSHRLSIVVVGVGW
jgi:hypothetical protein